MSVALGIIQTIAGTGAKGYTGDGGPALQALLSEPFMCAFDAQGNLYIAEATNHCVRRIDHATGVITTAAGTGASGYSGDGGPATRATLNQPYSLQIDANGDIYIADRNTGRVLRIHDGILDVVYRANLNAGENDVAGVAVAPDGTVAFTTGLDIRTIAADGGGPTVLSADAATKGTSGAKLAYGPDGTLYFGTGRLFPRVFRVDGDGKLTPVAGTGGNTGASVASTGPAVNAVIGRVARRP